MTLLSICQDAAVAVGLPEPSSIIGSNDLTAKRLLRLTNQGGKELARRYDWQKLETEASFTTVATESQGLISALGGGSTDASDLLKFCNGTMMDRTENEPVYGPLNGTQWQRLKADEVTASSFSWFRFRGNAILFYPTPPAGNSIYFEYISGNWCESSGGTGQAAWAADTDVGVLEEELLTLDLIWRYKKSVGLPWQEDYNECETAIVQATNRDGAKSSLRMDGGMLSPEVNLPNGNWTL